MERKIFSYKGKRYSMTDDEIDAGYYYRQRQNLYADAERHFLNHVFGDDPDNVSLNEQKAAIHRFEQETGLMWDETVELIVVAVNIYEKNYNCNVDENAAWNAAIVSAIGRRKRF